MRRAGEGQGRAEPRFLGAPPLLETAVQLAQSAQKEEWTELLPMVLIFRGNSRLSHVQSILTVMVGV